jgi:dTDP-4-dehydrorhamnose 3,5-epimerase
LIAGAVKDAQSVTADWQPVQRQLIEGVSVREARSVPKRNGLVTELYRADWYEDEQAVGQVFVVRLNPLGVSAWHAHARAVDRLTVIAGAITLVLYDARADSATHGLINEFHLDAARPTTVTVPARVWHGIRNPGDVVSILANMPDRAYQYEDPDHWRVPLDSAAVPYRWDGGHLVRDAV